MFQRARGHLPSAEVAATRPFGVELTWVSVLASVNRAVGRELTLRGIKDRVDLLIGYWRRQDAKNLKKSGTEEQYTEKEQILQDLSDYARAVQYEPRIAPRSAGCAVCWKKPGTTHDASRTSRAAQERRGASQLEEELAGDCAYSAEPASQICVAGENDGSPAAQLFLSVYDEELVLRPSAATSDNERDRMDGGQQQQSQVMSAQQEHPPSAPSSIDNDQRQPATRQQIMPAMGKGIRGLQSMGLQLLTMRETNEFHLRNKELAIERRKVENEEHALL
ncbi:uncharacterized protein LOC144097906 [Amblyomma americanum]